VSLTFTVLFSYSLSCFKQVTFERDCKSFRLLTPSIYKPVCSLCYVRTEHSTVVQKQIKINHLARAKMCCSCWFPTIEIGITLDRRGYAPGEDAAINMAMMNNRWVLFWQVVEMFLFQSIPFSSVIQVSNKLQIASTLVW